MGTNDFDDERGQRTQKDITAACIQWLAAVRKACPNARVFCVVPPLGWHVSEWSAAVNARRQDGDRKVHLTGRAGSGTQGGGADAGEQSRIQARTRS